jgi:hypothetical protein
LPCHAVSIPATTTRIISVSVSVAAISAISAISAVLQSRFNLHFLHVFFV